MEAPKLIELAAQVAGSDRALADALGATGQEVSNWRHGRRTCPPDMRARMAEMIGLDPIAELAEAYAENLSEKRRDSLRSTLKNAGMMCLNWWHMSRSHVTVSQTI